MANNYKQVSKLTKCLNKKGELRGSNKKETKMLKGICVHHKYNKNGKLKSTLFNNGDEYCLCTMCGQKVLPKFYEKDEVKDNVKAMKEMTNQLKFMAVATNSGENMVNYFCECGAMLQSYKKNAMKLTTIAKKQGNVKNKKKNKNGGGSGSSQYGSWGHN